MRKTTKKAAKKTTAKKASSKQNLNLKIDKARLVEFSKSAGKVLGLLLILLLVDLFVQYLNNDYSVAIVNGQRIPRREYVKNLETMYGMQVADALIEEELVKQLGIKEDISIKQSDIDEAYENIEEQIGGAEALQSALEANSMTERQLREQLENELVLKAIIEPTLEYTDEDLSDFFEEYKEFLYEDTTDITFEDKREEIEKYYVEQKTFEGRDAVLNEFREDVTIQINVPGATEDEVGYGFFKATRNLITNFVQRHNTN